MQILDIFEISRSLGPSPKYACLVCHFTQYCWGLILALHCVSKKPYKCFGEGTRLKKFWNSEKKKLLTKLSMVTIRWSQMWESSYSLETISLIVDEGASLLTTRYLLKSKSQNSKPLLITGPARWKPNHMILRRFECHKRLYFKNDLLHLHFSPPYCRNILQWHPLPAFPDSWKTNYVKIVEARGEKTR